MNTLTAVEKGFLRYILSEILKKDTHVIYGEIDNERIFLGTGYVARVFPKDKVPFDLTKNFRDCTNILKKPRFCSDMRLYEMTSDIHFTDGLRAVKFINANGIVLSYINEDLLKKLGSLEYLIGCEFKAVNNLSPHFVFKNDELIGFVLPTRPFE